MKAPLFTLLDQENNSHSLADYKGRWVVLYVYPKDDTPGCTKEACGFRDSLGEYKKRDIEVIGISKDTTSSHRKFATKFSLPFTLLSDPTKETIKAYGAWGPKKFMGRTFDGVLRKTYLIDPEGNIKKTYEKVDPVAHAQEILNDLETLKS